MTKTQSKKSMKFILKLIFSIIVTFLVLLTIGVMIVKYAPGLDIKLWFQETKWVWFTIRIALYIAIIGFIWLIHKRNPKAMPNTAKWLIISMLIFAETISQITLA